eukprot:gnl/MRDRNA2_/MRDRNA2_142540_c0_seq1.p1 gnl/MRDRNA2_/MRDRNA2_142540_c0~~gnl/MRDRNA2_/MRDRNA2_142540_c0_seq1.p1  ORF type:complete len:233 (+),score=55.24 gnl/MRDRNA2_/MRDRNA2_142540_c0_seq1:59-757(+)
MGQSSCKGCGDQNDIPTDTIDCVSRPCLEKPQPLMDPKEQLLSASRSGDLDAVRGALEMGVGVNYPSSSGSGCLSSRRSQSRPEMWVPDDPRLKGITALMYASQEGHLQVVNLLLEAVANPNAMDPDRMRPLHFAALGGTLDVCLVLIEARGNPMAVDDEGRTPFDCIPNEILRENSARAKWRAVLPEKKEPPTLEDSKKETPGVLEVGDKAKEKMKKSTNISVEEKPREKA